MVNEKVGDFKPEMELYHTLFQPYLDPLMMTIRHQVLWNLFRCGLEHVLGVVIRKMFSSLWSMNTVNNL